LTKAAAPKFELVLSVVAVQREDGSFGCAAEITTTVKRGRVDVRTAERALAEYGLVDLAAFIESLSEGGTG
jgi:hypothetical protein